MAVKKKYPEPYRRSDSKIYYFIYLGKDGRRRKMSTGLTAKEEARDFIRSLIDEQSAEATTLTFAENAAPYFKAETYPHFIRYRQEGNFVVALSMTYSLKDFGLRQFRGGSLHAFARCLEPGCQRGGAYRRRGRRSRIQDSSFSVRPQLRSYDVPFPRIEEGSVGP